MTHLSAYRRRCSVGCRTLGWQMLHLAPARGLPSSKIAPRRKNMVELNTGGAHARAPCVTVHTPKLFIATLTHILCHHCCVGSYDVFATA